MNNFKKISIVLFAAVLVGVVTSCKKKNEDPAAEGKKAGTEMCACVASFTAPKLEDFDDPADFQAAFGAYAMQLGLCLGVLTKYQQYVTFDRDNYDANADEPLYTVFQFNNRGFEQGFKEGTKDCMQTFEILFQMMGGQ
jgi:hypothetical protein